MKTPQLPVEPSPTSTAPVEPSPTTVAVAPSGPLPHARREAPAVTSTPAPAAPLMSEEDWPTGQALSIIQVAKGKARSGDDVVVITLPSAEALRPQVAKEAAELDGQVVWTLPATTKTWDTVLKHAGNTPIVRLTSNPHEDTARAAQQVITAAKAIRQANPQARVEWIAPAQTDPTTIKAADQLAATVDIIGLEIAADAHWPTTLHDLNTWVEWATAHKKRIAVVQTVDKDTRPGLVRSVRDWLALEAKAKRVAYSAAAVSASADSLAAQKAQERR